MSAQALADQFCPRIWLHPNEKHNPVTVETYLTAANVLDAPDGNIILAGPLSSQIIADNSPYPSGATLKIMESKETEIKEGVSTTNLNSSVPMYCHIVEIESVIYLTYIFFYGYNWNYPVLFNLFPTGAHWSDIEHITIEIDSTTHELLRVYFGAHTIEDGKWFPASEVTMTDGRVTGHSSQGSHGTYKANLYYLRIGGFANDTVGDAFMWAPENVILLYDPSDVGYVESTMGFLEFTGTWGNGKVSGMQQKFFWSAPDTSGESAAPWASPINIPTQWFIVAILLAAVVGVSGWAIYEFGIKKEQ